MSEDTLDIYGLGQATVQRLATQGPQPAYRELAERCPVHRTGDGAAFLFRVTEISSVVRNPDVLGPGAGGPSLGSTRPLIPLDLDGSEHRKYRRLLDPLFAPKRIEHLAADVRELTDRVIDRFIDAGKAELYDQFCAVLPGTLFLRIMGLPAEDLDYFLSFKNDLLRVEPGESPDHTAERARGASERFYHYFQRMLEQCAAGTAAQHGLIYDLMTAELEGKRLTHEEVLDICYLLMIAGLDTVAASLSCLFAWLARHPAERRGLVADPARWPSAIEELLRFETPVCVGARKATRPLRLDDVAIEPGTDLMISWAAANLDPDAFPDPLTVNLARQPNRHFAFGTGFHRCLGMHLARLELGVALQTFHARIPDYELAPDTGITYEALPIRLVHPLHVTWALAGAQGR